MCTSDMKLVLDAAESPHWVRHSGSCPIVVRLGDPADHYREASRSVLQYGDVNEPRWCIGLFMYKSTRFQTDDRTV